MPTHLSAKTLVPVGFVISAVLAGWSVSEKWFGLQQSIQTQVSAINVRLAVIEARLNGANHPTTPPDYQEECK